MEEVFVARANPPGRTDRLPHQTSHLTAAEMRGTAEEIKRNPLPVYLEHADGEKLKVGESVTAEVMKSGELAVAFKLDPAQPLSKLAQELIRTGKMRDVSVGWDLNVERNPVGGHIRRVTQKRPYEISIVEKGDKEGTRILGRGSEIEDYIRKVATTRKETPMADNQGNPAPAAAPAAPAPAREAPSGQFAASIDAQLKELGVGAPAAQAAPAEAPKPSVEQLMAQLQAAQAELSKMQDSEKERIKQNLESDEVRAFLEELSKSNAEYRQVKDRVEALIKKLESVPTQESQALSTLIKATASQYQSALKIRASELEKQVELGQKREAQLQAAIGEIKRLRASAAPEFAAPQQRVAALASGNAPSAPPKGNVFRGEDGPDLPRNPRQDAFFSQVLNAHGYGTLTDAVPEVQARDFSSVFDAVSKKYGVDPSRDVLYDALLGGRR